VPAFATVLMASTIFLSGSRGGMIAFLGQIIVVGTVLARDKNRRSTWTVFSVLLVVAVLISWVGGQALVTRIGSIRAHGPGDMETSVRLTIDRDGLRMFAKRPLLGWGLGNFATAYPRFRSFYTDKFINHAHNDYLQLLVETGLLGFATALWFIFSFYRTALQKLHDWESNLNGAVALAALMGCTGILIHSFLDSNLQVPANAALFYVLAAIATARTQFGSHRRVRHHRKSSSRLPVPGSQFPLETPAQTTAL
jgi:O-antigen ligase